MAEAPDWKTAAGAVATFVGTVWSIMRFRKAKSIDYTERLERVERNQREIHRAIEELKTMVQDNDSRVDQVERKQDTTERGFRRIERLLADIWHELTNMRGEGLPPTLPPRSDVPPSR